MVLNEATITPIPPHIINNNPSIVLGINAVKVNGIPFLVTISRVIKLGSATELVDTKIPTIVSALLVIMDQYKVRGFNVLAIAADYAFEPIRQNEALIDTGAILNTTSEDEHEPFSERCASPPFRF